MERGEAVRRCSRDHVLETVLGEHARSVTGALRRDPQAERRVPRHPHRVVRRVAGEVDELAALLLEGRAASAEERREEMIVMSPPSAGARPGPMRLRSLVKGPRSRVRPGVSQPTSAGRLGPDRPGTIWTWSVRRSVPPYDSWVREAGSW